MAIKEDSTTQIHTEQVSIHASEELLPSMVTQLAMEQVNLAEDIQVLVMDHTPQLLTLVTQDIMGSLLTQLCTAHIATLVQ